MGRKAVRCHWSLPNGLIEITLQESETLVVFSKHLGMRNCLKKPNAVGILR